MLINMPKDVKTQEIFQDYSAEAHNNPKEKKRPKPKNPFNDVMLTYVLSPASLGVDFSRQSALRKLAGLNIYGTADPDILAAYDIEDFVWSETGYVLGPTALKELAEKRNAVSRAQVAQQIIQQAEQQQPRQQDGQQRQAQRAQPAQQRREERQEEHLQPAQYAQQQRQEERHYDAPEEAKEKSAEKRVNRSANEEKVAYHKLIAKTGHPQWSEPASFFYAMERAGFESGMDTFEAMNHTGEFYQQWLNNNFANDDVTSQIAEARNEARSRNQADESRKRMQLNTPQEAKDTVSQDRQKSEVTYVINVDARSEVKIQDSVISSSQINAAPDPEKIAEAVKKSQTKPPSQL